MEQRFLMAIVLTFGLHVGLNLRPWGQSVAAPVNPEATEPHTVYRYSPEQTWQQPGQEI